jgi:hypothetical protein
MLRYCGPFLFLLSIPLFYYGLGPAAPLFSVVLLLAALTGAEFFAARGDGRQPGGQGNFRLLIWLYIPLQLLAIAWGVMISTSASAGGFAALAISLGVTTGVFGVLSAHEAVHSGDEAEAFLGVGLLTAMSYRHFRIAHIHGHHRWAGTEQDAATARLGESFYAFLLRTLPGQFRDAWRFEERRGGRRLLLAAGDFSSVLAPWLFSFARARWRSWCWSCSITSPITAWRGRAARTESWKPLAIITVGTAAMRWPII